MSNTGNHSGSGRLGLYLGLSAFPLFTVAYFFARWLLELGQGRGARCDGRVMSPEDICRVTTNGVTRNYSYSDMLPEPRATWVIIAITGAVGMALLWLIGSIVARGMRTGAREKRPVAAVLSLVLLNLVAAGVVVFVKWPQAPVATSTAGPRGRIVVDGTVVADTQAITNGSGYRRVYPADAMMFAPLLGVAPGPLAATGVERMADRQLDGVTGPGADVVLTISRQVQQAAHQGLVNRRGAVVAIDPVTGALLAVVSTPSYDPNLLAGPDLSETIATHRQLTRDATQPLLNRAFAVTAPPGATFEILVAAAALRQGATPQMAMTGGRFYNPPGTTFGISNRFDMACPQPLTLLGAMRIACDTAFARYCVEKLGAAELTAAAEEFGFGTAPLVHDNQDDSQVAKSILGPTRRVDGSIDQPMLALSCAGHLGVVMSPLQGALVAAAIANDGVLMRPYVVDAPNTQAIESGRPLRGELAEQLRAMMESVVAQGPGSATAVDGHAVGGVPAQSTQPGMADHGWFVGYARKGGVPVVAVAVLVEDAGAAAAAEATAIAAAVIKAATSAK